MIEIVFGVLGLVMLIGGKIPQSLFQMLFGKGYYDASPATARKLGLFLLTPAPLVILVTAVLTAVLEGAPETYVPWAELIVLCSVAALALLWARKFRKAELPQPDPATIPPITPAVEETPKDVFEMSDHEIREKLGLETPNPISAPPPPDPAEVQKWRTRRMLVMVIGILAGMGAPLIILLTMISDGELANRSFGEILAIFGICAFALIMAVVLIVFFGRQTRNK
jgi:hypothetical protein